MTAHSASRISDSDGSEDKPYRTILDDRAIRRALMRIAHEIVEGTEDLSRLYLVAIPNGGVPLGRILVENLARLGAAESAPPTEAGGPASPLSAGDIPQGIPLGIMDTTLYRDDLATRGSRPPLRRTEMPSSVDDRIVVLVEDVVNTGRTIRAAMDALMDFGRPSQVRVVALVDRGHRELPIKIDYVGKNIPTQPGDKVIFRAAPVEGADAMESASKKPGVSGTMPDVIDERARLELVVREGREGGGA